jgi:hypothetical protein
MPSVLKYGWNDYPEAGAKTVFLRPIFLRWYSSARAGLIVCSD